MRVTSGGYNSHPTASETTRGLLALMYERDGEVWRTFSLDRGESWAAGQQFVSAAGDRPRARYNHRGGFALVWEGGGGEDIFFEEILEVVAVSDDLVSCRISRSDQATSKGCDIVLLNPNRLYDPEVPRTRWTGVFQPGTGVVVKAGYGSEAATRFSGYIDDVSIKDETATIDFTGRGVFKQLLDQSVDRDLYYSDKKAVQVIGELAVEAGIDAEMIQIQDSSVRYTGEVGREKKYSELFGELAELLGFELVETDEGGLVCREPVYTTTPAWFYEEDVNMFRREREFSDDDVYTKVQVYRKDKVREDGSVEIPGFTVERVVDTPFLTPARKTYYEKVEEGVSEAQAGIIADMLARRIGLEGNRMFIASPLNVVLEVGDPISIRRESIGQQGVYIVEDLDDDMGSPEQARDASGQFTEGQDPAFASTITARRTA